MNKNENNTNDHLSLIHGKINNETFNEIETEEPTTEDGFIVEKNLDSIKDSDWDVNNPNNHLENIMDKIGFSKYHILVIILCSLLNFLWGAEQTYVSLGLYRLAQKNHIEDDKFSILLTTILFDMYFGVIIMQWLTKSYSRNFRLIGAVLIYFTCTVACNFMNDFYYVYTLRFIGDFFLGMINIGFDLVYEYISNKSKYKPLILMITSGFYNFGYLYNVMTFYALEKYSDSYRHSFTNFISCIPIFITLIIIFFTDDSPISFMFLNKRTEAFNLIKRMGESVQDDFNLSEFDKRQIINEYEDKKKIYKSQTLFDENNFSLTIKNLSITILISSIANALYFLFITSQRKVEQFIFLTEKTQNYLLAIVLLPNGLVSGLLLNYKNFNSRSIIIIFSFIGSILCIFTGLYPNFLILEISLIFFINYVQFSVQQYYVAEFYSPELIDSAQSCISGISNILGSFSPMLIELIRRYSERCAYFILGFLYALVYSISLSLPTTKYNYN